ncbi:MAG: DUF2442 domain-containing protein [Prevotellaceae bacterium]|jgi:hypothetical protein|nr:DUF2442 domain-containing protein [Prevotellaceae bacterium]
MYWTVKSVTPLENYWLQLTFENNEQRYYDMKPLLKTGVFCSLRDPKMFRTVKVAFDSISWDNNVDIAPETLYHDGVVNHK